SADGGTDIRRLIVRAAPDRRLNARGNIGVSAGDRRGGSGCLITEAASHDRRAGGIACDSGLIAGPTRDDAKTAQRAVLSSARDRRGRIARGISAAASNGRGESAGLVGLTAADGCKASNRGKAWNAARRITRSAANGAEAGQNPVHSWLAAAEETI